jgi:hypothetical protein
MSHLPSMLSMYSTATYSPAATQQEGSVGMECTAHLGRIPCTWHSSKHGNPKGSCFARKFPRRLKRRNNDYLLHQQSQTLRTKVYP